MGLSKNDHGEILCSEEQLTFGHFARAEGSELVSSWLQQKFSEFSIMACKWLTHNVSLN